MSVVERWRTAPGAPTLSVGGQLFHPPLAGRWTGALARSAPATAAMQEHRLALGPSSYPQGALIVRSYGSRACAGMRARFFAARTAPFCRLSTRQRLVKTSPKPQSQPPNLHLRRLTSRIAELTRRRQLHQVCFPPVRPWLSLSRPSSVFNGSVREVVYFRRFSRK